MNLTAWLPIYLLIGIFFVGALVFKKNERLIKGWLGEFVVNLSAQYFLDKKIYHLVRNVTLPTENSTTQIDHIIVSRFGIFVVETKNMKGWIFGSEKDKEWTQQIYRHRNKFQNPLRQNFGHQKALEEILGLLPSKTFSVIVFVGESEFKSPMPPNVTYAKGYIGYIKSKSEPLFGDYEVQEILDKIERYRLKPGLTTNRTHIDNLNRQHGKQVKRRLGSQSASPKIIITTVLAFAAIGLIGVNLVNKRTPTPRTERSESLDTPRGEETDPAVRERLNKIYKYQNSDGKDAYTNANHHNSSPLVHEAQTSKSYLQIEISGDVIFVPAVIGNKGAEIQTSLVLDRSSNKTILPMRIANFVKADNLRVTGVNILDGKAITGETRKISYLNIGTVVENDFIFLAKSFSGPKKPGILGMDFLSKHPFEIDRERNLLIWK